MSDEPQLREVCSTGGRLRFNVPAHWESASEEDTGLYFDPDSESALQLDVLTYEVQAGAPMPEPETLLQEDDAESSAATAEVHRLAPHRAAKCYSEQHVEEGMPLVTWHWELAITTPPRRIDMPIFSYTVRSEEAALPETQALIALLHAEILKARLLP